jgi:hypothetical protein
MSASLADLKRSFYNGGSDAELAALQSFYNEGMTFQDVLNAAKAVHNGTLLPVFGIVDDGVTDNSAAINALPINAGRRRLPDGKILCKSPIVIPKYTVLEGAIATTDTALTNCIVFDSTTIMAGGNAATVVANGATWVFTVPAGHGLAIGNTFTASGFAAAGFNIDCIISAVTATTLTVVNTTIPAANGAGKVNVHLVRIGSMTDFAPASALEHCQIECSSIPGSIGIYSYSIQEHGGLNRVTVRNPMYRGVYINSTDPLGNGRAALNYLLRDIRTVGSAAGDSTYSGLEIAGSNVSVRGLDGITCVSGGIGGSLPTAQVRFNGCKGALFTRLHVEDCTDGVLIGDTLSCVGTTIIGVSGNATCLNTVRIAAAVSGTNTQIEVDAINPNGSPNALVDTPSGVTLTTSVGEYVTDLNGKPKINTTQDGVLANALGADVAIALANTNVVSLSLPIGRWDTEFVLTSVPNGATTSVEVTVNAGTATFTKIGNSAGTIKGGDGTISIRCLITVTVAGTVFLRAIAYGAAAIAKQNTPNSGFANATAIIAVKTP